MIEASREESAPDTAELVTTLWHEVLELKRLDPTVGFFDLGATSVDVARVAARLRMTWPELRTVDLFLHPTLNDLVTFLDTQPRVRPAGARAPAVLTSWHRGPDSDEALICLPWAGAGAAPYRVWAALCPPGVDLFAVRLAARESRLAEPAPAGVDEAVAEIAGALTALPHRRLHLLGHCSGAIVAYELARALQAAAPERVRSLVVVGQVVPSRLVITALDRQVERFVPGAIRDDPELVELLLPVIAADTDMLAGYEHVPGAALTVPITTVRGELDDEVSDADLALWGALTSSEHTRRTIVGGRQLLPDDAWQELGAEAMRAVASAAPSRSVSAP